jgi:hypothetical protein
MSVATAIVRRMLKHLAAANFAPVQTNDGEVDEATTTPAAVMKVVTSVDMSRVAFAHTETGERGSVLLILCNDEDVISDWSYTNGGQFSATMDAFLDSVDDAANFNELRDTAALEREQ